ncbi:MAG: hypothetical protein ACLUCA_04580 [Mediterraneibacter gnavus]
MKSKIFCCYSLELRNYLLKNNFKYEVVGLNPTSKKMFWGFIKNKQLNETLEKWSRLK